MDYLANRTGKYVIIIVLAWLVIIFPSTFGSTWFYLDMPTIISTGKNIFNSTEWFNPNINSGRFVPIYWLYQGIAYLSAGEHPFGYFLIQSIVILGATILVFLITNKLTKNRWSGVLAVLLFMTGSPIAENAFTVGKPEHLILFMMLFCVWLFLKSHKRKYLTFASIVAITVLSVWAKETSMVIISFGITCTILSYVFAKELTQRIVLLTFGSILGVLLARLPYFLRDSNAESYYTSTYKVTFQLIKDNLFYYLKQQPDVFIIGLALLPFLISLLLTMKSKSLEEKANAIFCIGLYVMAWGYICGLLIWRWPFGYYLLVPSCIFNLLAAVVVCKYFRKGKLGFIVTVILILLLLLSKLYSIPYNYYVSTTQKSMDKVYSGAINQYMNFAKEGQRLFVEQWAFYEEPVGQSNLLLQQLLEKKRLEVIGIADLFNPALLTEQIKVLYNVKTVPSRSERTPHAGDFVLVITGNKPAYWNVRGVAPFDNSESKLLNMGWNLRLASSDKINNSLFYMDMQGKPKYGLTYLGYQLYRVIDEGSLVTWEGRYSDGWIGNKASCNFMFDTTSQQFKITVPNVNVPNKLSILNNNKLIKEVEITNAGVFIVKFDIESQAGNTVNLQFVLDKTFIPKQLGINNDDRSLGIKIEKKYI